MKPKLLIMLLLVSSIPMLIGCPNANEIKDAIAVVDGARTLTAADLEKVNPGLASALRIGGQVTHIAVDAYDDYLKAPAADKAAKIGKVRAAIRAAQGNLVEFLSAVGTGNPELVTYVTAYAAVANTLLTILVNHLPPAPASLLAEHVNLPVVDGARSAKDLRRWYNDQARSMGHETIR